MTDRRIRSFEIQSLGEDHPQYFQGAGTAFTSWEDVAVGIGENAAEAYEDACEMLAQMGWDTYNLPLHPRGIRKTDAVDHSQHEGCEKAEDGCEMQWYVAVFVK